MKLSIENKIFLEEAIRGMDYLALLEQFFYNPNLSKEDIAYMARAFKLPKKDFEEYIAIYDSSKPKMDELKFIQYLAKEYQVSHDVILKRISEIRRMNIVIQSYQENNLNR